MTRRDLCGFSISIITFIALFSAGVSSDVYTSGHDARYFSSAAAGSLMWADDFGDGDASDWLVIEGNWMIIGSAYKGEDAADGRSVTGEISWTNYRYDGVFMFDDLNYYEATILFRAQDVGAGANIGHYYEFANYVDLDEVTLWHISNGAADLVTAPYTFETGVWYQFALEVWGSSVRYYINEMLVIQYDQLTHYNQGRIGVKSFISAAWFDDLRVTSIDEPTGIPDGPAQPSPALVNFTNRPNPFRNTTTISFDLESTRAGWTPRLRCHRAANSNPVILTGGRRPVLNGMGRPGLGRTNRSLRRVLLPGGNGIWPVHPENDQGSLIILKNPAIEPPSTRHPGFY